MTEFAELLGYEWTARVIAENRLDETEDEGVAIVSRLPLLQTAVWPLPPSHPPRHRLEATIQLREQSTRLMTFHGLEIAASGIVALRDDQGGASDHLLVWADVAV